MFAVLPLNLPGLAEFSKSLCGFTFFLLGKYNGCLNFTLFTFIHHYEFAPPHTDSLAGEEEDRRMIMLEFPVLTQNTAVAMCVYLLFVVHICPASI